MRSEALTRERTSTRRMWVGMAGMTRALPQRVLLACSPALLALGVWGWVAGAPVVTVVALAIGSSFAFTPKLVAALGTSMTGQILAAVVVTGVVVPVAVEAAPVEASLGIALLPPIVFAWLSIRDALQWSVGALGVVLFVGLGSALGGSPEDARIAALAAAMLVCTAGLGYAYRAAMVASVHGIDPREQAVEQAYHAALDALEMALGTSAKKDRFLALMSFELRTPLTAILGYAELLGEVMEEVGSETDVRETRAIETCSRRLLHVVDDILDLSQIPDGTLELRSDPVDLGAVVRAALKQALQAHRSIRLSAEIAQTGLVLGDANRLTRVVMNMVAHALRGATPGDPLRVLLTSRVREVTLVMEGPPDRVEAEDLRRLRDGMRLPIDERPLQIGLELTMADALLRAMGGELHVERGPSAQLRLLARLPVEQAFPTGAGRSFSGGPERTMRPS